MLTIDTFVGPWAGLPVAWTDDDCFDEATYRADVTRCCEADIPGVYSGGTSGEFYAMEFDEFKQVARATVEACHACNTPAMIGCTSTYTLGVIKRAEYAAELSADAIQIALPYWMEVDEKQLVPFFQAVSSASNALPLSIYETTRAKRILTLQQHLQIKEAVPNYLMVKSNAKTLGVSKEGCQALSEIVNVFVDESLWSELGPFGARGSCSALVYWNPRIILDMWSELENRSWSKVDRWHRKISALHQFLFERFGPRGFTDTAFDRLGTNASGFLGLSLRSRGPYPSATQQDAIELRAWCKDHFPELLDLATDHCIQTS
ncbi:dihydrodipicolinate synthase family protein [Bythopirellula goksoeyrii]|uniref:4-hydroxy-tetrahydrodipicolinate synthase n=1 Tax=Bythopirellula goksoeyrii TaxID=1400387 RepID=A0A5B9QGM1_9BACT|nr:dihydrodipicolinate synthase family protein [Bythopirellula goksoeyrii]QEG33413.1 4-hydroxy-tetrahydrodipicolinate synthase [Bythopirellula goksoeyrii]